MNSFDKIKDRAPIALDEEDRPPRPVESAQPPAERVMRPVESVMRPVPKEPVEEEPQEVRETQPVQAAQPVQAMQSMQQVTPPAQAAQPVQAAPMTEPSQGIEASSLDRETSSLDLEASSLDHLMRKKLYKDTWALLDFALASGKTVPDTISKGIEAGSLQELVNAHGGLSTLIKPAIPDSVIYLADLRFRNKTRFWHSFSYIPLVRQVITVGLLSFLLLVFTSTSPLINNATVAKSLLDLSGLPQVMVICFEISIACLGAVFSQLPKLNAAIESGQFTAEACSHYWASIFLGLIGGIIMGELLTLEIHIPNIPARLDKIIFILLGGFAAESVFDILTALTNKIKQLFTT